MFLYSFFNITIESCIPIESFKENNEKYFPGKVADIYRFLYEKAYEKSTSVPVEYLILAVLYREFSSTFDSDRLGCGWNRLDTINKLYCGFRNKIKYSR